MEQKLNIHEEGYTVVEILVSVMIFTVVITIIGSLFIFSSKQMNSWRQSVNMLNEIHISSEILFKDLITAQTIYQTDSTLIIIENDERKLIYTDMKDVLRRNGILISDYADSHYVSGIVISDSVNVVSTHFKYGKKLRKKELVVTNRQPTLWGTSNK